MEQSCNVCFVDIDGDHSASQNQSINVSISVVHVRSVVLTADAQLSGKQTCKDKVCDFRKLSRAVKQTTLTQQNKRQSSLMFSKARLGKDQTEKDEPVFSTTSTACDIRHRLVLLIRAVATAVDPSLERD